MIPPFGACIAQADIKFDRFKHGWAFKHTNPFYNTKESGTLCDPGLRIATGSRHTF